MASFDSEYMADPPAGQGRFDAGTITTGALILGAILTAISILFVSLRVFTRLSLVKRSLGPDDWFIGLSLALAITFYGLSIQQFVNLGLESIFGRSNGSTTRLPSYLYDAITRQRCLHARQQLTLNVQVSLVAIVVYSLSVTTAKMSLLVLYLRLSPDRIFRIVVMSFIAFTTAYAIAYLFLIIFSCRPVQASWDLTVRPGSTCINKNTIYLVLSATNIVMDIVCLILPLKIIIPLQMGKRQKWSLIALFATGGFVCICAIRRTVLLPPLFRSHDHTFDIEKQLNWACVEVNAGIICASVPALKPFFMRYLPMFVHSHITGTSKKSNQNYQNYQTSMPYSTTVENNKKRRNVQSEAYELHSHDDLSLSSSNEVPKNSSNEDVTKLWSGNAFRTDRTSHRRTIIESKPTNTDNSSVDSLGGIHPVAENSAGSRSRLDLPQRAPSVHGLGGITVTTETRVVYEQS